MARHSVVGARLIADYGGVGAIPTGKKQFELRFKTALCWANKQHTTCSSVVERPKSNWEAVGSTPIMLTPVCGEKTDCPVPPKKYNQGTAPGVLATVAQLEECDLGKIEVVGSNPTGSSF